MLFSSINHFSSRQFRSSSSIASALLLMDLGGVRLKMARKNYDRINAVKMVKRLRFFKRWYAVGQRFFFQRYGNFILTPTVTRLLGISVADIARSHKARALPSVLGIYIRCIYQLNPV